MPITLHQQDKNTAYYKWGNSGHKYFFNINSKRGERMAFNKAIKQMKAAYFNGYRGN